MADDYVRSIYREKFRNFVRSIYHEKFINFVKLEKK